MMTSRGFFKGAGYALAHSPAFGHGHLGNLGDDGFGQTVSGDELGPLTVQGRQTGWPAASM